MCETHLALRTRPEVTAAELHGNPTYATSYSSLVVTCDVNLKKGAVYLSSELGHMEHHPLKQLHSHDTTGRTRRVILKPLPRLLVKVFISQDSMVTLRLIA